MRIAKLLTLAVMAQSVVLGVADPAGAIEIGLPPSNDGRADATEVRSLPYSATVDTRRATRETGEGDTCAPTGRTVWFEYEPADPYAPFVVTTRGSNFDTVVDVYADGRYPTGCNDEAHGLRAALRVSTLGGPLPLIRSASHAPPPSMYLIRVGGFEGASGTAKVMISAGGTIAGVARDAAGGPVAGACVFAHDAERNDAFGSATASQTGFYAMSGLAAGEYRLTVRDCERRVAATSLAEDGPAAAVAEGSTTRMDRTLSTGGVITGKVRDAASRRGIEGTCVFADPVDGRWEAGQYTYTSPTGFYRLGGLRTGSYRLFFCSTDTHAGEYWNNASDFDEAAIVDVGAGSEAVANAGLDRLGTISGVVHDANSRRPVANACVRTHGYDAYGYTSPTGFYVLRVRPGEHKVTASDCSGAQFYVPSWYGGETEATATPVPIGPGVSTTGIDVGLRRGGAVAGVVRDTVGNPISGICVQSSGDQGSAYAYTSETGFYRLAGVLGATKVRFDDCRYLSEPGFATEWFDNQTNERSAEALTVRSRRTVTADAVLDVGGQIEGRSTDAATGKPLRVCASAETVKGDLTRYGYGGGLDAPYRINGLRTGSYRVRFSGCDYGKNVVYQDQWFDGVPTREEATIVRSGPRQQRVIDVAIHAPDSDADGVPAVMDNCRATANPTQADRDGDDLGDACDPTP